MIPFAHLHFRVDRVPFPVLWWLVALALCAPARAAEPPKKPAAKPTAAATPNYAQRDDVRAYAAQVAAETGLPRRDVERWFAAARFQPKIVAAMDRPLLEPPKWFTYAPPFLAPEPYASMFDPASVPLPVRAASRADDGAQHPLLGVMIDHPFLKSPDDEQEQRELQATYYGMLAEVDDHVGMLLDWLETSGQADNTLVIFTSDHGENLGDHYMLHKLGWFDESYRVPLIVRGPGVEAGVVVESFTEHVDVLPLFVFRGGLGLGLDDRDRGEVRETDNRQRKCQAVGPAHAEQADDQAAEHRSDRERDTGDRADQCTVGGILRHGAARQCGIGGRFVDVGHADA